VRYSKTALLIFGAGLVLGLVVVAVEIPGLGRLASLAMAAGIALLPLAVIADWRRVAALAQRLARRLAQGLVRRLLPRRRGRKRRKRAASAGARPRPRPRSRTARPRR